MRPVPGSGPAVRITADTNILIPALLNHTSRAGAPSADNWMLGLAQAGKADNLISGDKRHILHLAKHGQTRIVTLFRILRILRS